MVCKEEVCLWFKQLSSAKRIHLLCGMLKMCIPTERRFIGSYIEELCRLDFNALRSGEIRANDRNELSRTSCNLLKQEDRTFINFTLCLLSSTNSVCSSILYGILCESMDHFMCHLQLNQILSDELSRIYLDVTLLLTIATNHPAFTISQKLKVSQYLEDVEVIFSNIGISENDEPSGTNPVCESSYSGDSRIKEQAAPKPVYVKAVELNCDRSHKLSSEKKNIYEVKVTLTNDCEKTLVKTYHEFNKFHAELIRLFPNDSGAHKHERHIPYLPQEATHSPDDLIEHMAKYVKRLQNMPSNIWQSNHVTSFFLSRFFEDAPVDDDQTQSTDSETEEGAMAISERETGRAGKNLNEGKRVKPTERRRRTTIGSDNQSDECEDTHSSYKDSSEDTAPTNSPQTRETSGKVTASSENSSTRVAKGEGNVVHASSQQRNNSNHHHQSVVTPIPSASNMTSYSGGQGHSQSPIKTLTIYNTQFARSHLNQETSSNSSTRQHKQHGEGKNRPSSKSTGHSTQQLNLKQSTLHQKNTCSSGLVVPSVLTVTTPFASPHYSPAPSSFMSPAGGSSVYSGGSGGGSRPNSPCVRQPFTVSSYLKLQRLHKYNAKLADCTAEQFINLSEEDLEKLGVTQGAIGRFKTLIEHCRSRLQYDENGMAYLLEPVTSGSAPMSPADAVQSCRHSCESPQSSSESSGTSSYSHASVSAIPEQHSEIADRDHVFQEPIAVPPFSIHASKDGANPARQSPMLRSDRRGGGGSSDRRGPGNAVRTSCSSSCSGDDLSNSPAPSPRPWGTGGLEEIGQGCGGDVSISASRSDASVDRNSAKGRAIKKQTRGNRPRYQHSHCDTGYKESLSDKENIIGNGAAPNGTPLHTIRTPPPPSPQHLHSSPTMLPAGYTYFAPPPRIPLARIPRPLLTATRSPDLMSATPPPHPHGCLCVTPRLPNGMQLPAPSQHVAFDGGLVKGCPSGAVISMMNGYSRIHPPQPCLSQQQAGVIGSTALYNASAMENNGNTRPNSLDVGGTDASSQTKSVTVLVSTADNVRKQTSNTLAAGKSGKGTGSDKVVSPVASEDTPSNETFHASNANCSQTTATITYTSPTSTPFSLSYSGSSSPPVALVMSSAQGYQPSRNGNSLTSQSPSPQLVSSGSTPVPQGSLPLVDQGVCTCPDCLTSVSGAPVITSSTMQILTPCTPLPFAYSTAGALWQHHPSQNNPLPTPTAVFPGHPFGPPPPHQASPLPHQPPPGWVSSPCVPSTNGFVSAQGTFTAIPYSAMHHVHHHHQHAHPPNGYHHPVPTPPELAYPHLMSIMGPPNMAQLMANGHWPNGLATLMAVNGHGGNFRKLQLECYNCGGPGHKAVECPESTLEVIRPFSFDLRPKPVDD